MSYQLSILPRASKELGKLPVQQFERIRDRIRGLATNPRPAGVRKLTGREGWRLRVGSYRVLYEIDDKQRTVLIVHIGHRRDVYRR